MIPTGLSFAKAEGAGNDFIILEENVLGPWFENPGARRLLCDRHFGVGADGILVLGRPQSQDTDYHMTYYNADGHEGTFCGNGARCLARFYFQKSDRSEASFTASDGPHRAFRDDDDRISVSMCDAALPEPAGADAVFVDTGSPHYVALFSDIPTDFSFKKWARPIRHTFRPDGVNVNMIYQEGGQWYMRTFERGVEDETLACGTGAVAAAIALHQLRRLSPPVTLYARGGTLTVSFSARKDRFTDMMLSGPAHILFYGTWSHPTPTFAGP